MRLSVVIVSYNVRYYLEQCLMSLRKALEGVESEVFVVDNHSRDGSTEYLRERFPDVTLVSCNHNLGFSRANNIAIRKSRGEYVLMLNPDTIVGEHTIREALAFMDRHEQTGGLGVRMMHQDGSDAMESRRALPTPMTSFLKMCGNGRRYYMSHLSWDEPARIDIVSGAFFMLRRRALDAVGLLDEEFFMYGEDIDLSYRLTKGGYENWYLPVRILHYKGESTQKSSFRYVHVFYEAMLIFFRKHFGQMSALLTVPIKSAIYLKALLALVTMQMGKMRKSLGFVSRRKDDDMPYTFRGSDEARRACQEILGRHGLSFEENAARGVVIFDLDSISCEEMLLEMADERFRCMRVGTYHAATNTIITGEEVLR